MQNIRETLSNWKTINMPVDTDSRILRVLENEFDTDDLSHDVHPSRRWFYNWRSAVAVVMALVLIAGAVWGVKSSVAQTATHGPLYAQSGPALVINQWFKAVQEKNAAKAVSYLYYSGGSKSKDKLVSQFNAGFKTDQFKSLKIKSVNKLSPDKALVKFTFTDMYVMTGKERGIKEGEVDEWNVTVLKVHGAWKIYIDLSPNAPAVGKIIKHVYG
jgi:hypothetical protein